MQKLGQSISAAIFAMAVVQPAGADAPRSAIPWLSESVKTAAEPSGSDATRPLLSDDEFETSRLAPPPRDGLGTLSPKASGFVEDIWGPAPAEDVRAGLLAVPDSDVPATRALFVRLLLADTVPPIGAGTSGAVLSARLDRLIGIGALDEAKALLAITGVDTPALFRRAFDIGVLSDDTAMLCTDITATPKLTPTLPARVFCLARAGDWDAAAVTLRLGHDLGEIPPEMEEALARFLDPDLFENSADPPLPDPLTPLHFVLRDAVGLPRPSGPLPLAFLHYDLADTAPLRARILAAERLARDGVLAPQALMQALTQARPAASGNPWQQSFAMRQLLQSRSASPAVRIDALESADAAFSRAGLRLALARALPDAVLIPSGEGVSGCCARRLATLFFLARRPDEALAMLGARATAADRLYAFLAGTGALGDIDAGDLAPLEQAALTGLSAEDAPGEDAGVIGRRIEGGRWGEGLLATLDLLAAGTEIDPGDLAAALYLLRALGLEEDARDIALQTLLLRPFG